jgi:hypothetical protein
MDFTKFHKKDEGYFTIEKLKFDGVEYKLKGVASADAGGKVCGKWINKDTHKYCDCHKSHKKTKFPYYVSWWYFDDTH